MQKSHASNNLVLDGKSLTFESIITHVRDPDSKVELSPASWRGVSNASLACDDIVKSNRPCYGVNLGFGEMVDIEIGQDHLEELQKSLIYTHAVGVNGTLSMEISRTIFLLRLNVLARGASGIRPNTMRSLVDLYNSGAYPEFHRSGSLGASGDLGPLAHLAAFAIGQGYGFYNGKRLRASRIFERLNLAPIRLARKEGLALINGTSAMLAIGIHAIDRIRRNLELMLLGMAFFLDGFRIPTGFLRLEAFDLKPHAGVRTIAEFLGSLGARSRSSDEEPIQPLQQVYSIRCVPMILGPLVETLRSVSTTLTTEANSVSDNPIFVGNDEYPYHGGHFHGAPVAVVLDQLRIAAVHLSGVIDRQLEFFLDRKRNPNVNPFLAVSPEQGDCGFEGAQYLVTSLHIENKMLSNPYSALVLPANAGNQDYVSMGMQSALNTQQLAENLKYIVGVYLLAGMQVYKLNDVTPSRKVLESAVNVLSRGVTIPYRHDVLFSELIRAFADDKRYDECIISLRRKFKDFPPPIAT